MPPENLISTTDLIAIAALLVAVLSAVYARGARDAANHANEISVRESLRPLRLQAFQAMHHFALYCSMYWTLYHMGEINRSKELTSSISTFEWEIKQHGHLGMVDVEEKAKQLVKNAWKMQRLVDRIVGGQTNPHDREYETAEDNIHGLVDWFAKENDELQALFEPYFFEA
jgi:hypothetical protein